MHSPVVGDVRLLHEDPDVSKNRSLWLRQFSAAAVVAEVGFEAVSFSRRIALLLAPAKHLVLLASSGPWLSASLNAGLDARVLAVQPAGRDLRVDRSEGLVLAVEDLIAAGRAQMHSVALAPTADWAVRVQRS